MDFGISFANVGPFAHAVGALALARAAEDAGFESLWTVEHVVVPAGYRSTYPYDPSGRMPGGEEFDIPDPLVWLTYVAAATERIRLATGILILPQRNPVVLAKEVATLDHLSGGRMLLGIGVGWLEEEFAALGVPFEARGRRTDDHLAAMRALWREPKATHHGEFTRFTDCFSRPQPVDGTVPVHVGGHSTAAARRAGRLGEGFLPGRGTPAEVAELHAVARAAAEEHGRDPDALELSAFCATGGLEEVKALADVGVTRVLVPSYLFWSDPAADLARFAEEVVARA